MCGRYSYTRRLELVKGAFKAVDADIWEPRYSIAPTNVAPVLRVNPDGQRTINLLRWGLIPSWAKDDKGAGKTINARSETVETKPSYRNAFKKRRCLVLADGWYEWVAGNDGKKLPFRFVTIEDKPFAFAGLWEGWKRTDGTWLHTFAIVTCPNQDEHGHIHDRSPVTLVEESQWADWLDPDMPADDLKHLLLPHGRFRTYRVGTGINYVRTPDGPHLAEPVSADV